MTDLTGNGVSLGTERVLASEHWLLAAAPSVRRARLEWADSGTTWLKPGALFGAVTVRASVVHAALLLDDPEKSARPLRESLGGPVFYAEEQFGREAGYVALVAGSVSMAWSVPGSVAHHRRAELQVPAPGNTLPDLGPSWWVVPLDGPGVLCDPDPLATLVGHGHGVLTGTLGKRP